jgi:hypothetical protein
MQWGPLLAGTVLMALVACGQAVPADPLICGHPKQQYGLRAMSECGPTLELTPVNAYQGEFSDVIESEDAVVLLDGRCTGTLIEAAAGPVVLTAGHCAAVGDRMVVVFNYEDEADGDPLVTSGTVIEQALEPDYALLELDALPLVPPLLLTSQPDERVAIIQHPRGRPKVLAEGWYQDSCNSLVYYSDLDTLVGSSGAGVLNRRGHLLGIHTDGDCDVSGYGTNRGWTADAVVAASPYLESSDIAAR